MSRLEAFIDDTPGEVRGVVLKDGRPEHLIIHRENDAPEHRLGATVIGRVTRIAPALKGVFVDLGAGSFPGFMATRGQTLTEGASVEVQVTAEPRDDKGPSLKFIKAATGAPRLTEPGPMVAEILADLVPGVVPVGGRAAIEAGWNAAEEALSTGVVRHDVGLDLRIERTRAMTVVDLDWAMEAGTHGHQARARANAAGLAEAARLMRLKSWGGLAAVDLIGVGLDGEEIASAARRAFEGEAGVVLGPVNRFGVLMASRPWGRTPVEARLQGRSEAESAAIRALAAVRALNHALLSNRAAPTVALRCGAETAASAEPWVSQLGPRARLVVDAGLPPTQFELEEG